MINCTFKVTTLCIVFFFYFFFQGEATKDRRHQEKYQRRYTGEFLVIQIAIFGEIDFFFYENLYGISW